MHDNRTIPPRPCAQCGEDFTPQQAQLDRGSGKYCSRPCYWLAKRAGVARICEACGGAFVAPPSRVAMGGAKYCSTACYGAANRGVNNVAFASETHPCDRCGTPIRVQPAKAAKGRGRFCSRECRRTPVPEGRSWHCAICGVAYIPTARQIAADRQYGYCSPACSQLRVAPIPCAQCGILFTAQRSAILSGVRKYCSQSCATDAQRLGTRRGCVECGGTFYVEPKRATRARFCSVACYHRWRRKHSQDGRDGWRYKEWRLAVYRRDGFTCQHCGQRGDLRAHHIKPFTRYPALAFAVDNGITLCDPCHHLEHATHSPYLLLRSP